MENTIFTHCIWSTRYLFTKNGVFSIYSGEMQSTAFTNDWWYPQHLLIRDGMASIYSQQMAYTAFTHERWKTQHLLIRDGDHTYWQYMKSIALISKRWSLQHFVTTDAVQSIDSQEMCPHLLKRYGVHSIDFQDMESTEYYLEKWIYKIYSWETEYTTFTDKKSSIWYLLITDGFHINYSWEMEYI